MTDLFLVRPSSTFLDLYRQAILLGLPRQLVARHAEQPVLELFDRMELSIRDMAEAE